MQSHILLVLFIMVLALSYLIPFTKLQLVNCHGMGKIKLTYARPMTFLSSNEYMFSHSYMNVYLDREENQFYSVFTHTHREIVEYLSEVYINSPERSFSDLFSYRLWGPINLQTLY